MLLSTSSQPDSIVQAYRDPSVDPVQVSVDAQPGMCKPVHAGSNSVLRGLDGTGAHHELAGERLLLQGHAP